MALFHKLRKRLRRKISSETKLKKGAYYLQRKITTWCIRRYGKTLKFEHTGMPAERDHCVFAFWHRNLLIMMIHRINSGIAVMVSSSDAGRVVAGPISDLGYEVVRGSSTRKGAKALINMIRLSREHSLAITPDGPSGPRGTIQPGIFQLAMLAKVPIVPVTAVCDREKVFNSWDRFRLPKFRAKIKVTYGEPIWVHSREDFSQAEEKLRQALVDVH